MFKELVDDGLIRYVGLSEAPPSFIRRAHSVTPISAVQQEWSLIARDLEEEGGVVDTCRQLGIGIVPYSPVARGFLSGQFNSGETPKGWRSTVPYLKQENLAQNVVVAKRIEAMASAKQLTLCSLVLRVESRKTCHTRHDEFEHLREKLWLPMLNWQKKKWKKLLTRQVTIVNVETKIYVSYI